MPVEIWITNVEHEEDPTKHRRGAIKQVCAWLLKDNNTLAGKRSYSRDVILGMLRHAIPYEVDGQPYADLVNIMYTASTDDGTNYKQVAKVVVTKDGEHLTTEGNPATHDDLGDLPPCDCTAAGSPHVAFAVDR